MGFDRATRGVGEDSPATVAILAGGVGRRLGGVAKGLIRIGNQTVIERTLEQLPARAATLLIANAPGPYAFLGLPIVGDIEPGRGAPGGVVTALAASATPWTLVVACDMPGVTREAMEALLAARSRDVDAVCFERQGGLEPLLGVYRRTLLPGWAGALAGNPSLRGLVRAARLAALPAPSEALLDSLNTPGDLAVRGARNP
jgi:molybdopterin-guanine dinucleotide biosynthesis protein A